MPARHVDRIPNPNYKNQLAEAVRQTLDRDPVEAERFRQLRAAYQRGGRKALHEQFRKFYPDKVPPLPDDSDKGQPAKS